MINSKDIRLWNFHSFSNVASFNPTGGRVPLYIILTFIFVNSIIPFHSIISLFLQPHWYVLNSFLSSVFKPFYTTFGQERIMKTPETKVNLCFLETYYLFFLSALLEMFSSCIHYVGFSQYHIFYT